MIPNTPVCMFSALSFFAWFYQNVHISKNIPQAYKVFAIKPTLHISATTEWILMNKLLNCSYELAVSSCTCQIRQRRIPDGTRTCHAKQWPTPPSEDQEQSDSNSNEDPFIAGGLSLSSESNISPPPQTCGLVSQQ